MRIIGEIPHPDLKITVFEMNAKVSIQIEDSMEMLTYRFRDGSMVTNFKTASKFCDDLFLKDVKEQLSNMRRVKSSTSERMFNELGNSFPEFI